MENDEDDFLSSCRREALVIGILDVILAVCLTTTNSLISWFYSYTPSIVIWIGIYILHLGQLATALCLVSATTNIDKEDINNISTTIVKCRAWRYFSRFLLDWIFPMECFFLVMLIGGNGTAQLAYLEAYGGQEISQMGNDDGYNPYRCRTAVRIIAVLDILFSTFLLGFYLLRLAFYEGKDGDMTTGLFFKYGIITDPQPFYYFTDELQRYYIFIWIAIFFVYTLQLIMAIILLFGACQNGTEDSRRRCKVWCSSLAFIKTSVGVEFFILAQTFAKFGVNYVALSLWSTKLIFRLLAEKVVCAFVKDLTKASILLTLTTTLDFSMEQHSTTHRQSYWAGAVNRLLENDFHVYQANFQNESCLTV